MTLTHPDDDDDDQHGCGFVQQQEDEKIPNFEVYTEIMVQTILIPQYKVRAMTQIAVCLF